MTNQEILKQYGFSPDKIQEVLPMIEKKPERKEDIPSKTSFNLSSLSEYCNIVQDDLVKKAFTDGTPLPTSYKLSQEEYERFKNSK